MRSLSTNEQLAAEISILSREQIIDRIMSYEGRVRMDFTHEFLSRLSDGQLRHILSAVYTHISVRSTIAHPSTV